MAETAVLLVVDDNPVNLTFLARRLEREGYTVIKANGGQEAIDLITVNEPPIDLVLLDLFMPEVSGIEVLDFIRGRRASEQLPVIMVSAATEIPRVVEAMRRGANDYVTKPVDFPKAFASIKEQLARRPSPPTQQFEEIAHYEVQELIGEGGMSHVYRCRDKRLQRLVALKVLSNDVARDPEVLDRFQQEAQAVARLRHPGVVGIYEIGHDPVHYIAMELLEGRDLEDYLRERGKVTPDEARATVFQILDALAAVHERQIIHRDLKPSNVMLEPGGRVRLMDFGLAKLVDSRMNLTQKGDVWGTPYYLAPEQVDGSTGTVDARSDLFAVGSILYRMLTGRHPVRSTNLAGIVYDIVHSAPPPMDAPDLPPALCAVCMKALSKNAADRFQTARDFSDALLAVELSP